MQNSLSQAGSSNEFALICTYSSLSTISQLRSVLRTFLISWRAQAWQSNVKNIYNTLSGPVFEQVVQACWWPSEHFHFMKLLVHKVLATFWLSSGQSPVWQDSVCKYSTGKALGPEPPFVRLLHALLGKRRGACWCEDRHLSTPTMHNTHLQGVISCFFFFVILICNILVLASIHIYPHPANTLFLAGVFGWSDQLTCRLSRGYCIKDDCKVVHNSEGLWRSGLPRFSIKRHPCVFYIQEVASSILGSTIISKVWTRRPISAPCKYMGPANLHEDTIHAFEDAINTHLNPICTIISINEFRDMFMIGLSSLTMYYDSYNKFQADLMLKMNVIPLLHLEVDFTQNFQALLDKVHQILINKSTWRC